MNNTITIEHTNDGMQVHKFACQAIREGADVDHGVWASKSEIIADYFPDLEGEEIDAEIGVTKWHGCTRGFPRS
jgi:hypothetical protein